jgi:hypothetical protein
MTITSKTMTTNEEFDTISDGNQQITTIEYSKSYHF